MEDRLAQINNDFSKDCDFYYRKQLQALQYAINRIQCADLYSNEPLGVDSEDMH